MARLASNAGKPDGGRTGYAVPAIILSVAAVLAYAYFRQVDKPNFEPRLALHRQIIDGSAPSPYRYRILAPLISEALRHGFVHVVPEKNAFLSAYAVFDFAALFFSVMLLFVYLRQWFSREQALVGTLFAAATMPMALRDHYYQPWSLLDAGFFAAGLLCIFRKRLALLAIVIALASINRETAVFIPLSFLLAGIDPKSKGRIERRAAVLFAGYLGIWAIAFFGLRYILGAAPNIETVGGLFSRNLVPRELFRAVVHAGLLFGAFWVFAAAGFRHAPSFVRRMTFIVPLYLVTVMLWSVWYEVRLLVTLYPIVIPLGLSFMYHRREYEGGEP